jgi:DNA-binding transcriptional LysR family regulator
LYQSLWNDNYSLALPAQHPLCTQQDIQLSDFKKLPLIKRTPCEAWEQVALALSKANIKPQVRANIHTIEYAIGLVGAGIGAALLPDFEMQKFRPDLQYRPIAGLTLQRELVLAFAKEQQHQSTVQALCQVAAR